MDSKSQNKTREPTNLPLQLLEEITDGFSKERILGKSAYGTVYKGVHNGKEIAVKKLFPLQELDHKEFKNECLNLMMVQHHNVVQLVGYCDETRNEYLVHKGDLVCAKIIERALCFEYMEGGSLAKHISDESCGFDWLTRYKIIKGICEGLNHLHNGRDDHIYHLDLKPDNILLDKNMMPKIADFGMSRLFASSKTRLTQIQKGTLGYMPPEFIDTGKITKKYDVFSVGVIIMQIMAGAKGYHNFCDMSSPQLFIVLVRANWKKRLQAIPGNTSHKIDILAVQRCIELAVRCVEGDPAKRPSVMEIVNELNKLDADMKKMPLIGQKRSDSKDLEVDPALELRFPFELKRDISCCLQLTNRTDDFVAFNIKINKTKYCTKPNNGTISPCSKCYITVTLREQEKAPPNMQCSDMFLVQSVRVREDDAITEELFKNSVESKAVDEVKLPIVYVEFDQTARDTSTSKTKISSSPDATSAMEPRMISSLGSTHAIEAPMSSSLGSTRAMELPMVSSLGSTRAMELPMVSSLRSTRAMEASMSSSLGAMGPLLRKLDLLLPPEYRLSKPLTHRIQLLKEDLEEINVALVEQSMADSPNEMASYWMNEVREISYDIDDFVDDMMLTHTDAANTKIRYVHRHRVGRVKTAWRSETLKPCTRAAKVAELRALVREASERHDMYLDGCTSSPRCLFTTGHAQTPALYALAANYLVCIDDSKKLVQLLTNETEQQLKVVAIVGPAGIGKTTLAKQVYYELEGQFDCRAFVQASRKPDMRRLLAGILSQVQRNHPSDSCTVQDLIDNLNYHLQDKRYVIVIDDLWETIAWDIVTSALPEGNNRSRIVTTAELEGVALECCDYKSNNILKMKPLVREETRKLFFSIVFGPERSCPEQLKEFSDLTITKCAGLPLATICVAGLLASQPDNSEVWQHVQEYLCSNLSINSTSEETLQEILKLSYNSLPHYLKTCLMYLSMYPEGYTMWKDDLVKQWVAECFISATEGQDREEVAERYFDELVNRGMIQPVEINYNDEVLSCTLHHLVLDLVTHKSNEEKFITALDYSQTITGLHSKARRLSLHFSNTRYATKPAALTLSQVRTLTFFGMLKCMPSIVKFKFLRVLVIEFWGDPVGCTSFDLTGICRLFQLRYLKISGDVSVEIELPAQMRRLQYLEALKINARVSAVPLDLPGLLHLSLGDKTRVSLVKSDEHLKRNLVALASSIEKRVNLKSVFLQTLELLPPICIFSRIPKWIGQLNKLCILKVVVSELLMKDMDMLTGLPALTIFSLYVRQCTAESIIFKRGAFPALKYFKYTCDVLSLAFQEEALPNLHRLELSFNAHRGEPYDYLLAGIENLLNLKEIAGRIGAATGAEEPDRGAAESAFNDAIRKHPRFPSYGSVKRVDRVDEDYGPEEKQQLLCDKDPSSEQPGIREKESVVDVKQNAHSSQVMIRGNYSSTGASLCGPWNYRVQIFTTEKVHTDIESIDRGLKSELLSVHTRQLPFPMEPNKLTTTVSCPLHLKNNTAHHVAFRLLPKEPKKYFMGPALFGFVPPNSRYTIAVTMCEQLQLSSDNGDQSFTLETTMVDCKLLLPEAVMIPKHLFEAAPSKGREVHQIKLIACSVRSEPEIMIISDKSLVYCIDIHPTEPLIMTTQHGVGVRIWNYQMQEVKSVETSGHQVTSAKFIAAREQRIVVGASDGTISVYSYDPAREICMRREHRAPVNSLAIHATKRYVLSASADGTINMWNYEMGMTLARTFHPKGGAVLHVAFNPMDTDTFACANKQSTVKIWDMNSGECKLKLPGNWVGYFSRGDKLYLITYSKDTTAKIWDCQTGHCVQTSKGNKEEDFVAACSHPDLPVLITGSNKGLIHLWNSTSLRLNSTMNFGLGKVQALACLKGSRRIVIGYEKGLALADISSEERGAGMGSQ